MYYQPFPVEFTYGTKFAYLTVKMAIISLNPRIDGAKERSPRETRRQRERANREKNSGQIFTSVRRGFGFLVTMAILTYAYANRDELQNWVNAHVNHLVVSASRSAYSGVIRQSALNHEKEVDQVTQ